MARILVGWGGGSFSSSFVHILVLHNKTLTLSPSVAIIDGEMEVSSHAVC